MPNIVLESGLIGDDVSRTAYSSLLTEIDRQKASAPDGYGYVLSADGGKVTEYADFAWASSKVLLFTIDNIGSYERLVNSQSQFKCYLLTDSFDYVAFVKEVNE